MTDGVYILNAVLLGVLKRERAPRAGESDEGYLSRLRAEGRIVARENAGRRDAATSRAAVDAARDKRVPLLIPSPSTPTRAHPRVVRLKRSAAEDPRKYRAARARALAVGGVIVLVD